MTNDQCGFDSTALGASGQMLLVQQGPTILVNIGFEQTWIPTSQTIPKPDITDVRALIDTGATECCIDEALAIALKFPRVDTKEVSGSSGRHTVNIYSAQIFIPSLKMCQYGRFAGVMLTQGGQQYQAIIGRTLLRQTTLLYEGQTGRVVLSNSATFKMQ